MEVARWVLVLLICSNVGTLVLWLCEILRSGSLQADCDMLRQELDDKDDEIRALKFKLDLYKKRENVR